ncbi:hypothetical protein BH24ACT15_BH24ACT15_37840 [soil metagenome]
MRTKQTVSFQADETGGSRVGQAAAGGAGLDDLAVEVRRSTIAAQSLGSVKVFVQPENGSLEAIAMADFSWA